MSAVIYLFLVVVKSSKCFVNASMDRSIQSSFPQSNYECTVHPFTFTYTLCTYHLTMDIEEEIDSILYIAREVSGAQIDTLVVVSTCQSLTRITQFTRFLR